LLLITIINKFPFCRNQEVEEKGKEEKEERRVG